MLPNKKEHGSENYIPHWNIFCSTPFKLKQNQIGLNSTADTSEMFSVTAAICPCLGLAEKMAKKYFFAIKSISHILQVLKLSFPFFHWSYSFSHNTKYFPQFGNTERGHGGRHVSQICGATPPPHKADSSTHTCTPRQHCRDTRSQHSVRDVTRGALGVPHVSQHSRATQ